MRRSPIIAVLILAAVIAGCGGSSNKGSKQDQAAVTNVITQLTNASRTGNAGVICDQLFAPALKASVTSASKKSCAAEVKQHVFAKNATFSVQQVAVSGSTATARVTDQFNQTSLIGLVKQNGKWQIIGVTRAS